MARQSDPYHHSQYGELSVASHLYCIHFLAHLESQMQGCVRAPSTSPESTICAITIGVTEFLTSRRNSSNFHSPNHSHTPPTPYWSPPMNGRIKINMDAFWNPRSCHSGIWAILRNSTETFVAASIHHTISSSALEVKALAILYGCNTAKDLGYMNIEVESDSRGII